MHQLHPHQVLPGSSLPHLQPPVHAGLHSAPRVPASAIRGQPLLRFAPLADFHAPAPAVHSSPVLLQPSRVHAAPEQSPAPRQRRPRLGTSVPYWLPAASTSGASSLQGASSVTASPTPQPGEPLMMETERRGAGCELGMENWTDLFTVSLFKNVQTGEEWKWLYIMLIQLHSEQSAFLHMCLTPYVLWTRTTAWERERERERERVRERENCPLTPLDWQRLRLFLSAHWSYHYSNWTKYECTLSCVMPQRSLFAPAVRTTHRQRREHAQIH